MLKTFLTIGSLASALLFTTAAGAQAMPTAIQKANIQAGGGWSYARPDYGHKGIQGWSAFADMDFGVHWGVEADIHHASLITPEDLAENSYMFGPRFIVRRGRFKFYGKGLVGIGDLVIQLQQDNVGRTAGTQFAYAAGGGVEVVASRHIVVRALDFEYQHWNYLTGLTPAVFTTGVAYRFR
jgi:hypothetical protein